MTDARRLVDKLWSHCNVLRDDGVGTIEYTEQLTYLLFLKMAHERANRALKPEQIVPRSTPGRSCSTPRGLSWRRRTPRSCSAWRGNPARSRRSSASAEPHPGPRQAQAPDRRPDRQGELVRHRHRHQGRRLRGAALEGCGGHQVGRGSVPHPSCAHPGDGRLRPTHARGQGGGPGCRHLGLPAGCARVRRPHLDEFVECYMPGEDRGVRVQSERFKAFSYDELVARDKVNLDITWLLAGQFPPAFTLAGALKDVDLILAAGAGSGTDLGLIPSIRDHFARSVEAGHGDLDMSAIYLEH